MKRQGPAKKAEVRRASKPKSKSKRVTAALKTKRTRAALTDSSLEQMRAQVAYEAAQRRVAAFMERTSALPWMRGRFASFEIALLAGVRNLLLDSAEDEARGRNKESRAAHYTFLYGIFTSLRYLFFWYALQARLSDVCAEAARPPEMEDAERIMAELEIFNSAAVRADVQAGLRAALDEGTGLDDIRRRVTEQARVYDLLNTSKEMPKA